jgi:hypothetical protein
MKAKGTGVEFFFAGIDGVRNRTHVAHAHFEHHINNRV